MTEDEDATPQDAGSDPAEAPPTEDITAPEPPEEAAPAVTASAPASPPAGGPGKGSAKPPAKAAARPPSKAAGPRPPSRGAAARVAAKQPATAKTEDAATSEETAGGALTKGSSKANQSNREKRAREIERRKAEAAALAAKKRKMRLYSTVIPILVVAIIAGAIYLFAGNSPSVKPVAVQSTPLTTADLASMVTGTVGALGSEGVPVPDGPLLADTTSMLTGATVDGVQCQTSESLTYHIHAHLSVYVNGQSRQIPALVGINNKCLYWLHTHAADGIIHVESPTSRLYTLGDFFKVWNQPLSATQVGPVTGQVTVFYNGKKFTGSDPNTIPLQAHDQIQLDVGTPVVAPVTVPFGSVQ